MAFAEPRWLLGLLALGLPIALHLRGRRRGSVVHVGSLRWLEGRAVTTVSPRRLHRPWLLLLRCAAIAALVIALAGPTRLADAGGSTWVLVAPEVAARAPLDSLRRLGELRLLAGGLPGMDAAPPRGRGEHTDVWSLLREADASAPASVRFVVAAPSDGAFYTGVRPRLRREVRWLTVAADSAVAPVARAPSAVTIVAPADRAEDARVIAAAFGAVGEVHGDAAPVRTATPDERLTPDRGDWIVWLGDRAMPSSVSGRIADGLVLLTDGDTLPVGSGDRVVWRTETGEPRLVSHRIGLGVHYRLRGRFHPASWPGVLDPDFASQLDSLRVGGAAREPKLSERQRSPALSAAHAGAPASLPAAPRTAMWVLLALACLLAERLLTAREPAA